MEGWSTSRLGNLCFRVSSGGTPLRSISEYYENGTVPWLKTGEVKKGLIYNTEEKITENGLENSSAKLISANSVIVAMYGDGDTAGNVAINKISLATNQACCNFTLNPEQAHYRFVYYYLKGNYNNLINLKLGGSQQNLNAQSLKSFPINHPDIETQEKIAAILSAYDEQIENNQQHITLLEKMAEEIYREWFVRLRFPGHEKVRVIKSVPEGWSFDKASMFFGLSKGKSYAAEELTNDTGHMPFINLKSFNRGGGYREDGLKYYSGRYKPEQVVHQNDVVVAVTDMTQDRAVIGQVARMPDLGEKGAVISLDTVKLVPGNIHKTFLYAYMRHSGFANFIKEFANGANVLHLKPDLITKQKVIIPPKQLQKKFAPIVEPLYAEADLLEVASRRLEKMLDALLPRLISGKLSVENLNIQFPPSMTEELKAEPAAHA